MSVTLSPVEDLVQDTLDVHGQGVDLSAWVGRHARTQPDAVVLTFEDSTMTFAELHDRAGRLARLLADEGVRTGDRVALLMQNRPEFIEATVAVARLGAILVPLNFRLSPGEITYQLVDSGALALLTDAPLAATAESAAEGTEVRRTLVAGAEWEQALGEVTPFPEQRVDAESCSMIMYTSGTTGAPKGAMLSHSNVHTWMGARIAHQGYPIELRTFLVPVPLFHIGGMLNWLTAAYLGGRMVLTGSGAFDPAAIIDLLARERVNQTFLVPAQWQAIVRHPAIEGRTFPDLILASWGAAPASPALVQEILDAFPRAQISTAFGQTETCSTSVILRGVDAVARPGSVGKPMLHVECRLVDLDMNDVAPGEVGEIVYRGPTVMMGYWNAPEKTAEAFKGGWFHSGDLLRADEEGFLYVVDRLKDMIISGGENVYCAEVEAALAAHPKVGTVAVIGVPDERWGEVPVAIVVARGDEAPTSDEIESFGRERLAAYKVPKQTIVVDELPVNANGKIVKGELRRAYQPKAGL
ncbi:AMP-binding protein [Nocardioides insulae]|uniref:AMP-binding protein n=1 Tax=Nocardioides insulae TaxID=394734 RepID=UPI0003FB5E5A|nr:AMP-binding protein [Nocardioides insulae]